MKLSIFVTVLTLASSGAALAQENVPANCDSPQSTQEINYCVSETFDTADAELNAIYKKAMASQVQLDKDLGEGSSALVGAADALKAAQRAWIAFRDTNCVSRTYINAGGTIRVAAEIGCETEMTKARTKELQELISGEN